MCHAEDAQRAGFFLKESRLCGKGTGMRGLQGRRVCVCARFVWGTFPEKRGSGLGCGQTRFAPTAVGKEWLEGKTTLFLRKK